MVFQDYCGQLEPKRRKRTSKDVKIDYFIIVADAVAVVVLSGIDCPSQWMMRSREVQTENVHAPRREAVASAFSKNVVGPKPRLEVR